LTDRGIRDPSVILTVRAEDDFGDRCLVGDQSWPRPGEFSLAHRGVLFLDELIDLLMTRTRTDGWTVGITVAQLGLGRTD
jgi:hypothetical protein